MESPLRNSKPHPRRPAGRALPPGHLEPVGTGSQLPPGTSLLRKWPSLGFCEKASVTSQTLAPRGLTLSGTLMLQAGVSQEKTPQCSQEGLGQALKTQGVEGRGAQKGVDSEPEPPPAEKDKGT